MLWSYQNINFYLINQIDEKTDVAKCLMGASHITVPLLQKNNDIKFLQKKIKDDYLIHIHNSIR